MTQKQDKLFQIVAVTDSQTETWTDVHFKPRAPRGRNLKKYIHRDVGNFKPCAILNTLLGEAGLLAKFFPMS